MDCSESYHVSFLINLPFANSWSCWIRADTNSPCNLHEDTELSEWQESELSNVLWILTLLGLLLRVFSWVLLPQPKGENSGPASLQLPWWPAVIIFPHPRPPQSTSVVSAWHPTSPQGYTIVALLGTISVIVCFNSWVCVLRQNPRPPLRAFFYQEKVNTWIFQCWILRPPCAFAPTTAGALIPSPAPCIGLCTASMSPLVTCQWNSPWFLSTPLPWLFKVFDVALHWGLRSPEVKSIPAHATSSVLEVVHLCRKCIWKLAHLLAYTLSDCPVAKAGIW